MGCRVCSKEIGNDKYCYSCGWRNSFVSVESETINIDRLDRPCGLIKLQNMYSSDIDVSVTIKDVNNSTSFVNGFGDGESEHTRTINVPSEATVDIKLMFDLERLTNFTKFKIQLHFQSDDACPEKLNNGEHKIRPYNAKQTREWDKTIDIEIHEPSKLIFDQHFLLFDKVLKKRTLKIKNIGFRDLIKLEKQNFVFAPGYDIHFPDGKEYVDIVASGKSINKEDGKIIIIVEMHESPTNESSEMIVNYFIGGKAFSETILLHHRKDNSTVSGRLPRNIVAVDFGTSKTAVAKLSIDKLKGLDRLSEAVRMIELEPDKKDIPSCIAYFNESILIGTSAKGLQDSGTAEYISSMKTKLIEESIETKCQGKTNKRNTIDVVTDFLILLRKMIQDELNDMRNIKYYFTLPILDKEQSVESSTEISIVATSPLHSQQSKSFSDAKNMLYIDKEGRIEGERETINHRKNGKTESVHSLYQKQKQTTLFCANEAGFGDIKNIETRSEAEAAMYYIINTLKNPEHIETCNLQDKDNICIFDFGAGTLDICFSKFKCQDGKPDVDQEETINLGLYKDEKGQVISIGGNRIDNLIVEKLCAEHNLRFQDDQSSAQGSFEIGMSKIAFEDTVRILKEKLSTEWHELSEEGVEIHSNNEQTKIYLTKKIFSDIVNKEISYAIKSMRDIVRNYRNNPKYIFMVGGSSLIKIAKEKIKEAFPEPATYVYNAYDYSVNKDYIEVREASTYPIVLGSAMSFLAKVTNIFPFDLIIAPVLYKDNNDDYSITYRKGESFYIQDDSIFPEPYCWGEWIIEGSFDGINYFKLDAFEIKKPEVEIYTITLITKISKDRKLKISYKYGINDEEFKEEEIAGIEVYV